MILSKPSMALLYFSQTSDGNGTIGSVSKDMSDLNTVQAYYANGLALPSL